MPRVTKTDKEGVLKIGHKEYKLVGKRVQEFRNDYKDYSIVTEEVLRNKEFIKFKSYIKDKNDRLVSTGHAEIDIKHESNPVFKSCPVESCETKSVGRALAFFGLAGEEFASADEVLQALKNQDDVLNVGTENKSETKLKNNKPKKAVPFGMVI